MKKIPDNAKKVFEGIIFDVYHWEQELFDGSKTIFEAVKRSPSVSVVAISDNSIIYNHEEQPGKPAFDTIPGGRVEKDDTLLGAAKRELLEETGFESQDWVEWFNADGSNLGKLEWQVHYFIAKNCTKKKDSQLDAGEKITTTLVPFDDFLEKRNQMGNRTTSLEEILEKAATDETEKQKLKQLLGITT